MKYNYSSRTGVLHESAWSEGRILEELTQPETGESRSASRRPPDKSAEEIRGLLRTVDHSVASMVPESIARNLQVVLIELQDEVATVASARAWDIAVADKLTFILAKKVVLVSAAARDIELAIQRLYSHPVESCDSMICEFTETAVDIRKTRNAEDEDSEECLSDWSPEQLAAMRARRVQEWRPAAVTPRSPKVAPRQRIPRLQRNPGMFYMTINEGERVLRTTVSGTRDILIGPCRVWKGRSRFEALEHHIAHPGQFLIVRLLDGSQQHLPGPVELWNDPRIHESVACEDCLQLASKEAVVVYARSPKSPSETSRRIVYGPMLFTPQPGEWLHHFSWHASPGGHLGVQKIPNALKFEKLWLMPDQMYHDVPDVRTADNAVLVIRLMVFFELTDIERMLESTRDPIGDFVNAATADVVEFTGRLMFEEFKQATNRLNELATYRTLLSRAEQIGYRVSNVVYRGYGAAESLQKMHDQAIEGRTRLQLDRATEEQSQELENFRLKSQLERASMRRLEQTAEVQHSLEMDDRKQLADLQHAQRQVEFDRTRRDADDQQKEAALKRQHTLQQDHLNALKNLGVDLTAFLTQNRADQIIELRGHAGAPHVHLQNSDKPAVNS